MSRARLIQGHVLDLLRALPTDSVPCVVTSPPYWGQRDYGLAPVAWGGDPEHAHVWGEELRRHKGGPHGAGVMLAGGRQVVDAQAGVKSVSSGAFCACGAWRGCLGLEPDPWLYLDHLVEIFEEARRVLRPDGTLWLNLGDSYAGSWGAQGKTTAPSAKSTLRGNGHVGGGPKLKSLPSIQEMPRIGATGGVARRGGLKPKDLVGIPWRAAFALQDAGWWLRSDIVWHKTNAMPESVRDRPAKAHEYVFLLTKRARYYYDGEAVRTPLIDKRGVRTDNRFYDPANPMVKSVSYGHGEIFERRPKVDEAGVPVGSNLRSVWPIASQPYPEAHFATFPPNLVEPCVLAGSRRGDEVLDIFSGAATTGLVALRHGRDYRGFEQSGPYIALSAKRLADDIADRAPLFDSIEVELEAAC